MHTSSQRVADPNPSTDSRPWRLGALHPVRRSLSLPALFAHVAQHRETPAIDLDHYLAALADPFDAESLIKLARCAGEGKSRQLVYPTNDRARNSLEYLVFLKLAVVKTSAEPGRPTFGYLPTQLGIDVQQALERWEAERDLVAAESEGC